MFLLLIFTSSLSHFYLLVSLFNFIATKSILYFILSEITLKSFDAFNLMIVIFSFCDLISSLIFDGSYILHNLFLYFSCITRLFGQTFILVHFFQYLLLLNSASFHQLSQIEIVFNLFYFSFLH